MTSTDRIRELAEPLLAAAGLQLWDVEVSRDAVRVMVDRPGGVDLDALTAANAAISPVLDAHPELAPTGSYQLEVSSPGVERSLRTPDHYRRYVGSLLSIKTVTAIRGARRWRGRLLTVGADSISIDTEDGGESSVELPYDQIDTARTVLEWGAAPKPTGSRATPTTTSPEQRPRGPRPRGIASNLKDSV